VSSLDPRGISAGRATRMRSGRGREQRTWRRTSFALVSSRETAGAAAAAAVAMIWSGAGAEALGFRGGGGYYSGSGLFNCDEIEEGSVCEKETCCLPYLGLFCYDLSWTRNRGSQALCFPYLRGSIFRKYGPDEVNWTYAILYIHL
jgi:hypothetical protein